MENLVCAVLSNRGGKGYGLYFELFGRASIFVATPRGLMYCVNLYYQRDESFSSTHIGLRTKILGISFYNATFQREQAFGLGFRFVPGLCGDYRLRCKIYVSSHAVCSATIDGLSRTRYPSTSEFYSRKSERSDARNEAPLYAMDDSSSVTEHYYDN